MSAGNDQEQYYPFAFSSHAYVQCNGDILFVRPCSSGLYWNQERKICDREETAPARPSEDQPKSFQINYNTQETKTTYNRPLTTVTDQSVDKQQGYRYRNYNPNTISTDQRSTFTQINSRQEPSRSNSFFSIPSLMKSNRVMNQQEIVPVDTDKQSGQSMPSIPSTQQRGAFRLFQMPQTRMADSLNTQLTSSSYRRR
jgi:hypothetical protein